LNEDDSASEGVGEECIAALRDITSSMKLEHVAIYTKDLEALRSFYTKYFQAVSNDLYVNPKKGFRSYFLSFSDGARLELMQMESIPDSLDDPIAQSTGIIHIAFSLGARRAVDQMSERLREDGFRILDGPRQTGDGYYECAFLDPDGNRLEITE
jgi:lactoylglutathione lyase